ncbi:hypothetical protein [Xanthomonas bundabergensis]|uniref:amino acid kinase family protein n=1 Tax=Xanthomonas bundabergensis TaxID=3160842 RepID=UPI003517310E
MSGFLVFKFGGSSFNTDHSYRRIAAHLQQHARTGSKICVVVSAMSGTTGALAELLQSICPAARPQDVDAVLTTGELVSAALLCAALAKAGVSSRQVNAYQLGWLSTADFTRAELLAYPSSALLSAFEEADVVVVPGGQAMTARGEITMLGRNSSDLTALVCAKILQVSSVRIYSDVEGIYTADPFKVSGARLIPRLGYDLAGKYANAGAKVLHPGCLAFAKSHSIEIECAHYCQRSDRVYLGSLIAADGGESVQLVILPNDHVLWETPDRTLFESWKRACRRQGVTWFEDSRGIHRIVLAGNALSQLDWEAPGQANGPDQRLLLAFERTGETVVHLVPERHLEEHANAVHAELVQRIDSTAPSRELTKSRSRFSTVYQHVSAAEGVS